MKLAESSRRKFELFFRKQLKNKQFQLPAIYFYTGRFSQLITTILNIQGITIGRNVFVKPKFVTLLENKNYKIHVELAAHEIAHVLQFEREGFFRFLFKYLKSFAVNLKQKGNLKSVSRQEAYWEIPFEIQARDIAAKFVKWNKDTQSKNLLNSNE
jgi:hypothetical protein